MTKQGNAPKIKHKRARRWKPEIIAEIRGEEGKWKKTTPQAAGKMAKVDRSRVRWRMNVYEGGKRKQVFFATEAEAKGKLNELEVAQLNQGAGAFEISAKLREEAKEAERILAPFGVSVLDAAEEFARRQKEVAGSVTVEELVSEFIEYQKGENASGYYVRDLRLRLGRFKEAFGERSAADLTKGEIDKWLLSLGVGAVTRGNFLRNVKAMFSYAVDRDHCTANPAADVKVKKPKRTEAPAIFSANQAAALLKAAETEKAGGGKMVPYFAIGLFAGIRPEELKRLDWSEIDLKRGHIEVTADNSKTATRRFVDISENLKGWLIAHARVSGAVAPPNLTKLRRAAMAAAKIKKWPVDVMRHSFVSFHLARWENAPKTALQAGHTDASMIFKHYREVVKKKEAERFWAIMPPKGSVTASAKIRRVA